MGLVLFTACGTLLEIFTEGSKEVAAEYIAPKVEAKIKKDDCKEAKKRLRVLEGERDRLIMKKLKTVPKKKKKSFLGGNLWNGH